MLVVAGASGRIGGLTVEALIRRGHKVRALVRTRERAERLERMHAEVVCVDFFDTESLAKALKGATSAFLLLPTPPPEADFLATNELLVGSLTSAVKRAMLPALVLLSSVGAQHPTGTGPVVSLHHAEKALSRQAKSVTFLRAASALEWWAPLLLDAIDSGKLPFFGHIHRAFPQVGARDVAEAAALALEKSPPGTRTIEVAGAQNWSPEEVAHTLASLLGQSIHAEARAPEDEAAYLEHVGLSAARASLFAERSQALARGLLQFAHPHEVQRGNQSLFDALSALVK
jgi:uncharacterized protein YbjT (DUF2867 family)